MLILNFENLPMLTSLSVDVDVDVDVDVVDVDVDVDVGVDVDVDVDILTLHAAEKHFPPGPLSFASALLNLPENG